MIDADDIGLCCGSLVQADFLELVEAASGAGFKSISMWPTLFYSALENGYSEADLITILDDNGLRVTELDPYCAWLPVTVDPNDMTATFFSYGEDEFFRMADVLGGSSLNVIEALPSLITPAQRVELLAELCLRAATRGLQVSMEFLPWSPIGNLDQAVALVQAVGQSNFGVNIDLWHHFRSGGTVQQLATLDPHVVTAVQLNDVALEPWSDILEETSLGRELPGAGVGHAASSMEALYSAGVRSTLNVEVFSAELMALPALEAAQHLKQSIRQAAQLVG